MHSTPHVSARDTQRSTSVGWHKVGLPHLDGFWGHGRPKAGQGGLHACNQDVAGPTRRPAVQSRRPLVLKAYLGGKEAEVAMHLQRFAGDWRRELRTALQQRE